LAVKCLQGRAVTATFNRSDMDCMEPETAGIRRCPGGKGRLYPPHYYTAALSYLEVLECASPGRILAILTEPVNSPWTRRMPAEET
jgi:hypothetical protein